MFLFWIGIGSKFVFCDHGSSNKKLDVHLSIGTYKYNKVPSCNPRSLKPLSQITLDNSKSITIISQEKYYFVLCRYDPVGVMRPN